MNQEENVRLFDSISHRYDFLNHLLSLYQDVLWRKKMVSCFPSKPKQNILDIATGTGDVLLQIVRSRREHKDQLFGIDLSGKMLNQARKKINREKKSSHGIDLQKGNAEKLPFDKESFDIVTVAFGLRNMSSYDKAISEVQRVLKKDGLFFILEFSIPQNFFLKPIYLFYFRYILPFIGWIFSGKLMAYRYLNRSVESFLSAQKLCELIQKKGFESVTVVPMNLGIVSLYCAKK